VFRTSPHFCPNRQLSAFQKVNVFVSERVCDNGNGCTLQIPPKAVNFSQAFYQFFIFVSQTRRTRPNELLGFSFHVFLSTFRHGAAIRAHVFPRFLHFDLFSIALVF
jgi:hypothetical protein